MADQLKVFEGTLTSTETTVYTVPANKALILQGFFISNANANPQTFTLKIGSNIRFVSDHAVPANDTLTKSGLEVPILQGGIIKLVGAVENDMDYCVWGIEIDV